MKSIVDVIYSYFLYLTHPFKTHDMFMKPYLYEEKEYIPQKLTIYESLGTSWIFVVINGVFRIFIVNLLILGFIKLMNPTEGIFLDLYDGDKFIGFYFLVLSTILDVIFYPLFGLFLIQFWEFVIKMMSKILPVEGDVDEKAKMILSVSLSSHILMIVPIFGDMAQKLANFILMYAGLRKQLNYSPSVCLCILFSPLLILLGFFSLIMLLFVVNL